MGGCQHSGSLLGTLNIRCRIRDPKRDHNFDNHPYVIYCGFCKVRAGRTKSTNISAGCQPAFPPTPVDAEGSDIGGCRTYGPFLGTRTIRCRSIIRIQKETILLTTTHINHSLNSCIPLNNLYSSPSHATMHLGVDET